MASQRPYHFTGLPRFAKEQIALEASLTRYLAGRPYEPEFAKNLAADLERYIKLPCKFSGPELKGITRTELAELLPEIACIIVVGAGPSQHKILVELDMGLAASVIDRLLGGTGDADRIQRPLTEIEEGVLSFIVLKALTHFHAGLQNGQELALYLDSFASKLEEIKALVEANDDYMILGFRVGMGKQLGYARIVLPTPLITERFGKSVPQDSAGPEERAYMLKLLDSLGKIDILARLEMATLDLAPADLAALEAGDIIIVENHQITKTPEGFEGQVFVRLGAGENGGLRARIITGEPQRVEITEIVRQENPEAPMEDEAQGAENLAETEGLLRDVPAPVIVELARLHMSAAQVIRLRQGQVLRLPRAPTDPVDIVVNGKVFARGELIEVDGELGVRLVQVVGAGG